ncbi:hypothetical protein DFH09DRAFT_1070140 [Mycena vulgaris]|nr:hypothetical protein DFH09DRAFT_1070140 [Mycena vulgaris]
MRLISVIHVSASLVLASFAAPVNHPAVIAQVNPVHTIPLFFSPSHLIPMKDPNKSLPRAGSDLFDELDLTARQPGPLLRYTPHSRPLINSSSEEEDLDDGENPNITLELMHVFGGEVFVDVKDGIELPAAQLDEVDTE